MAVMRLIVRQACLCTVSGDTWSVVRATELTSGQPHNTASMLTWTGCPHGICSPRTLSEPYPDSVSVTWINIKTFKDGEYIYLTQLNLKGDETFTFNNNPAKHTGTQVPGPLHKI